MTMQDLLDAGVHFGSLTHTWNPRMKPFIHGKRNKIHIINLVHTVRGLTRAAHFLREVSATGRQIVFVGTKRQMQSLVLQEATRCEMPWVTQRWLGGTLTNFKTVRSRLGRLEEIEHLDGTGQLAAMKKKAQSQMGRELRRIRKNLEGLRSLNRIPGALLIIDPRREHIAVAEAARMGVPVVGILDTDCDPSTVDIAIPANDDSIRSVGLILGKLTDAVIEGNARFRSSGRAPEDALGVRHAQQGRGGGASFETAKEMLASSGMAERVIAASDEAEPAAGTAAGSTPEA
ncbi:MAG TPA: 30S ribosomal protein S2 [Planctomycetota bacterium]|nr:30S ribosomal protein S2 [Planctomycetota bacterium]